MIFIPFMWEACPLGLKQGLTKSQQDPCSAAAGGGGHLCWKVFTTGYGCVLNYVLKFRSGSSDLSTSEAGWK